LPSAAAQTMFTGHLVGLSVRIEGWQEIVGKLERIQPAIINAVATAGAGVWMDLTYYPPQQQGMTYERTGRLGRGWQKNFRAITTFHVWNDVWYAPDVQGAADQKWIHATTGWQTEEGALEKYDVLAMIQEEIDKALGA